VDHFRSIATGYWMFVVACSRGQRRRPEWSGLAPLCPPHVRWPPAGPTRVLRQIYLAMRTSDMTSVRRESRGYAVHTLRQVPASSSSHKSFAWVARKAVLLHCAPVIMQLNTHLPVCAHLRAGRSSARTRLHRMCAVGQRSQSQDSAT
jgi:hypothetical protein